MNIVRFFKKPPKPFRAVQWNGSTQQELEDFAGLALNVIQNWTLNQDGSITYYDGVDTYVLQPTDWFITSDYIIVVNDNLEDFAKENWDVVTTDNPSNVYAEERFVIADE